MSSFWFLRRRAVSRAVVAVAVAALALTSCSEGGSRPAAGNSSGDAFPVTIGHKYGSTTITERPRRVAVVGLTDQDALLALGTVPVTTTQWLVSEYPGAIGPWAEDALGDTPPPTVLDDSGGFDFEAVAKADPDLIVGLYSGMTGEDYDTFSQIAPTVAQPKRYADYGIPWQELTTTIGTALGRQREAERLVSTVEDRIARIRDEHPAFARSRALVATTYEGYFVYGSQDPRSRLLKTLGFALPDGLDRVIGDKFGANLSRERADLLDTDALVWFVGDGGAQLDRDALYNGLRVAKQRRDVRIDESDDYGNAFSFASVLSVPYVLDRLVPQLEAALDGDPRTTA